jgi:hypothetical protein
MDGTLQKFSEWTESKQALYGILCFSALLKISVTLFHNVINSDGILYIAAAQEFALGHFKEGLNLFPLPLYPYLLSIVYKIIPNWIIAARFISATALVLAVIPLYLLTKDLFDRKTAFWAALAFSLAPVPNGWALDVIRGPVYVFVFAWAVYYSQRTLQSPRMFHILIAVCLAWLSALFRIEGILLIGLYPLFIFGLIFWQPPEKGRFIKGVFLWITVSILILITAGIVLGYGKQEITNFFQVRFPGGWSFTGWGLDNYYRIYQELKIIENTPPVPLGKQNFFAIARHYMSFIYLLGLLESLIRVLFPFFVIPLFWGFRHSLSKSHLYIITILAAFLLIVYYSFLMRDFISKRFLFASAFLLYPWIGAGLHRIFSMAKQSIRPKLFATILAVVFILAPLYKCIDVAGKRDRDISTAGHWLASKTELYDTSVITTDLRFVLYAKRKINFPMDAGNAARLRHFMRLNDFISLEQFAFDNQMDILVVRVRKKSKNALPELTNYRKLEEFTGKKKITLIYCSRQLYKSLNVKEIGSE